jgi:selenide,water dikinase
MLDRLLLFPTTRFVIRAENTLLENNIKHRVIPVPKDISAECGMAIELLEDTFTLVCELFEHEDISFSTPSQETSIVKLTDLCETGGCSAKLEAKELSDLLAGLFTQKDRNLLVSPETHDDAGVVRLPGGDCLIQTVDFFPPMVDDPQTFGRIAAANALSDVYAMGGRPLTALNIVLFPADGIPLTVLRDILKGGAAKIRESGALLVGGHTIADPTPKYGCAISGLVKEENLVTNSQAETGDILVLTKPLGTGTILAASKLGMVENNILAEVIHSMETLNNQPISAMHQYQVKAGTDITGFGLFGHLHRMAQASFATIELVTTTFPIFPQVLELHENGCIPGAAIRNHNFIKADTHFTSAGAEQRRWIGCDAQTSGGLLLCIKANQLDDFCAQLEEKGITPTVIGKVIPKEKATLIIK